MSVTDEGDGRCVDGDTADAREVPVMARYRKTATIEAVQWFKNGDHPADGRPYCCYIEPSSSIPCARPAAVDVWFGPTPDDNSQACGPEHAQALAAGASYTLSPTEFAEGKVVRYYRRPDAPGDRTCSHCARTMHEHGWIDTLEGGHTVCPGDWIATGAKGEHWPIKPDVFAATYAPAMVAAPVSDREVVVGALEDAARTIADVQAFDRHVGECNPCARIGTGCAEGDRLYDEMVSADTGPKANVAIALALLAKEAG